MANISGQEPSWLKVPIIGSFAGVKQAIGAGLKLHHLSTVDRTTLVGSKIFKHQVARQQASHQLLRGLVAFIPFIGGASLFLYDKYFKRQKPVTDLPFPTVLEQEPLSISEKCAYLRDPTLIDELLDDSKIGYRVDNIIKKDYPYFDQLKSVLKQIPQTNDKHELRLLRKAWIEMIGQNVDCDLLAKLNFTPDNIKKLGYPLLEDFWIETLRRSLLNNQMIEPTRDVRGVSDISMAVCFSVLAKYPKLKCLSGGYRKIAQSKDIKYVQVKHTKGFATPVAIQSAANLLAADRETFFGLEFANIGLNEGRAKELAQGLIQNTHIRLLDLFQNPIGDKGMIEICKALYPSMCRPDRVNGISLIFSECQMGDQSIDAMLQLLQATPRNVSLTLGHNNFTREGINRLQAEVKQLNQKRPNKIKLYGLALNP